VEASGAKNDVKLAFEELKRGGDRKTIDRGGEGGESDDEGEPGLKNQVQFAFLRMEEGVLKKKGRVLPTTEEEAKKKKYGEARLKS